MDTTYYMDKLGPDDVLAEAKESVCELIIKAKKEAIRRGIKANSIVINKNMVEVPEMFATHPHMICGLNVAFTKDELPDGYSFAVCHDPNIEDDPVKLGRWVIDTWVPPHSPTKIYVRTVCSECDERIRTESFDIDEWNDYKKDRYVIDRKNYCPNCGLKMDLEEIENA